jgi:triosephosphate isomerase
LAYEPRWAIGQPEAVSLDDIQSIQHHLRQWLATQYDASDANRLRIIYGGSVNLNNAAEIFALDDVDGLFVGRSALNPDHFAQLIQTVYDGAIR